MIRVKKISHASYETPDLSVQKDYYTEILGLTETAAEKDAVYFANTVDHHSVVLRRGEQAQCTRIGFQIGPEDDLDAFEKQVQAQGVATERKRDAEPGIADMVSFADTKGTIMEVFRQPQVQPIAFSGHGIVPHKLGHVAFQVDDAKKAAQFYCDVLGFRVSDWMADFFCFLRCGPDHHTINLMGTGKNKHFHTAFEVRDWAHIQTASDFLSLKGYKLLWGPGRHGIGHNLFAYHRSPNGLITELFAELDQMPCEELGVFAPRPWHRDHPQKPKVWERSPDASNLWGKPPPPEMLE